MNNIFWFYSCPYVPSGVIYGDSDWPSHCVWLVPGWDPDSTRINMYPDWRNV